MAGISNIMPDQVFSPSLPIMAKSTADFDHVSQLLTTIVATENAQVSVNSAYDLTDLLLNSVGPGSLVPNSVLDFTRRAAADKKNAGKRQGAMFITGALFERFPPKQPLSEMEFLVRHPEWLYMTLDGLADKTMEVRDAAQYALNELLRLKAEPLAVGLLPALIGYLSNKASKWQGNVGAFGMLDSMAKRAIEANDEGVVLREALGGRLESLIPYVEAGMHDLKSEVRTALEFALLLIRSGCKASPQDHERAHETLAKRRHRPSNTSTGQGNGKTVRPNSAKGHPCAVSDNLCRHGHVRGSGPGNPSAGALSERILDVARSVAPDGRSHREPDEARSRPDRGEGVSAKAAAWSFQSKGLSLASRGTAVGA
jgi:hypothetical protein